MTKTKRTINHDTRKIIAILAIIAVVMTATVCAIQIPKAMSKGDETPIEQTHFEEADSYVITKMEMTTYVADGKEYNNYYISMEGKHVVFMAEVNVEQYLYYNVGDTIPGTLIVDGDMMNFELDEFGKSFIVLGYVGLSD